MPTPPPRPAPTPRPSPPPPQPPRPSGPRPAPRHGLLAAIAAVIVAGLVLIVLPLVSPHRDPVKVWIPPHGFQVVSVPNTSPNRIVWSA
jgi:hypothetical protein